MDDLDITSDLADAGPAAAVQPNATGDAQMQVPAGTQPVHGDATPFNQQEAANAGKEVSLRDQLSGAFKGTDNKPSDQQDAQTADPKPPVALTQDSDGKWRTPDGLFASNEQVQAFQAAQQPAQQPDPNAQQQQSPVLQGLTPAEQQQLQSLPAELRQYVERTMEGLNTRAQRYSEYDTLEQAIIGPRRQAWAQQGTNPLVAMNQLFALSDFASTNPGQFVMWFAEQQNLDLDAMLDAKDAANAKVDPALRQLQSTVHQLAGTVQQFQSGQVQQAQNQNLLAVEQFAQEKDPATGTLKRPYLTDVMDGWATQIGAIRASNPTMPHAEVLERAYDAACWADPKVRGQMQQKANEAVRTADAQRAANARAAGASVTGAPAGDPASVPNNANLSLRDELQQAYSAATA